MATQGDETIVQIEKLKDNETYPVWKFQITIVLKSMGLYEIVSGQSVQPTDSEQKTEWLKKDARAQKIIVTSVERQPLTHILTCVSAKEMFQRIRSVYERDTEQQKCQLLQEFFNYKYQKSQDMATHVSTLQNMAYKLKVLNTDIDEIMISKILATLPDTYKHFASTWDSTSTKEKTLISLTARLLAGENRMNTLQEKEEPVAFKSVEKRQGKITGQNTNSEKTRSKTSNTQDKQKKRCFKCNEPGHFARSCKNTGNIIRCGICKKTNHAERDCYFRKTPSKQKNEDKDKVSFMAANEKSIPEEFIWILDSGSSSHMVNDEKLFKSLTRKESEIGIAKKKETIISKGIGTVETENCILNDVLFVPELSQNLLSVSAIVKNGGKVDFARNKAEIKKYGKTFVAYKTKQGLWAVAFGKPVRQHALLTKNQEIAYEWHRKLGHLGAKNMMRLMKQSDGMKLTREEIEEATKKCEICARAKQVRTPFGKARTRATRPLELIGRVPLAHGAIAHCHSQRPVPRDFPLSKRCEWLVSN